jgi:DNA adenine methylase
MITKNNKARPFLKWVGGKYRLIERISTALPIGSQLIEPFVGSGAVFLNTNFKKYVLNDANADLIGVYHSLQEGGEEFIESCRPFFKKKFNTEKQYYALRKKFNTCTDRTLKSALFVYLNRHGYNGLCRYNTGKGEFNVPFGRYAQPYFPELEMRFFYEKTQKNHMIFVCEDFSKTLARAKKGSVVYCDPPYVPLTETAYFTAYRAGGFSLEEHRKLAVQAQQLGAKGIPVLISNHNNEMTQQIYKGATIQEFTVRRLISCKSSLRGQASELLALYK